MLLVDRIKDVLVDEWGPPDGGQHHCRASDDLMAEAERDVPLDEVINRSQIPRVI